MRVPFPTRIPLRPVVIYAVGIFAVQQFQHTALSFSLLYFAFVILSAVAFNIAGGLASPAGAYVFWFALFVNIVGVTFKAFVNEAADSNLLTPVLDMAAYTASMAVLVPVVLLNRALGTRNHSIAKRLISGQMNYTKAGFGCLIAGIGMLVISSFFPATSGGVLSLLDQINFFLPLAVILGTIGAIKDSGGRRTTNLTNVTSMFIVTGFGLLGYSKEGMLAAGFAWIVAVAYCRFNLRKVHLAFLAVYAFYAFSFAPVWAGGRNDVPATGLSFSGRVSLAVYEAENYDRLQDMLANTLEADKDAGVSHYLNTPQPLVERLTMMAGDDQLMSYSSRGNFEGYAPLEIAAINTIPHFLYPNKPTTMGGNYYAREMGLLPEYDVTTGISFSATAEAYHLGGWAGILFVLPILLLLLFESIDFVCGELRDGPWVLLVVVFFAHLAPEGGLGVPIGFTGTRNAGLVLVIFFVARIAPVMGSIFMGKPSGESTLMQQRLSAPPSTGPTPAIP